MSYGSNMNFQGRSRGDEDTSGDADAKFEGAADDHAGLPQDMIASGAPGTSTDDDLSALDEAQPSDNAVQQ